tara:strand:- start:52 stop:870 length:819 start_codon:yes stop_codon:yes gene_type:complete
MIPKIIHQIWFQGEKNIKQPYKYCRETCLKINKNYKFLFWDQPKIEHLIKNNYSEWWGLYNNYPHMIQKIDFAKWVILHKYGGIYMDMDMECIKQLESLITDKYELVFSSLNAGCKMHSRFCVSIFFTSSFMYYNQPFLSNGFFACVPNHPFWIDILNASKNNSKKYIFEPKLFYIQRSTGNALTTNIVRNKWINNSTILHYKYLEPCESKFDCQLTEDSYAKDYLNNSWMTSDENSIIYIYFKMKQNPEIFVILILVLLIFLIFLRKRLKN